MLVTLIPLVALFASCFILMLGFGLIGLLLPVRMGVEQVPTDTIGLVLAMYAIGMLLGGRFSRHLIQRVGHIRVFAACASLGAMAILACALYVNPWLWGAMRLLMGFCLACAFAVIDGWLSDVASESMRGRILASSQVTIMAAVLISQFLINLAPIETQTLFILAGMLLCFSLLPLVMSRRTAPIVQASSRMSYAQLARLSPLGVVGCFFAGLLYGSLMNMLPIFAGHYALSGMLLSLFMASAVLGAFILQFPIGMLADKFDRRTVLLGLLSITLISSLSVPVLAHFDVFLGLLLLTAITTGILSCLYPLSISETFDKLTKADMPAAMGSLLSIYALGSFTGPISASVVMKHFGSDALFTFLATFELILAGFVLHRMRVRDPLPINEQETFVMQTDIGSPLYDLDPRIPTADQAVSDGLENQVVLLLADDKPATAVRLVDDLLSRHPEKARNLVSSLVQIESVDVGLFFTSITRHLPELQDVFIDSLVDSAPDRVTELTDWLRDNAPDKLTDAISIIAHHQQSAPPPHTSNTPLRPADRTAAQQQASELIDQITQTHPDRVVDVAAAVVNVIPEMASDIIDKLHAQTSPDQTLSSELTEKPANKPHDT